MMDSPAPSVSILIVTYRNPDLTRRCVESVISEIRDTGHELLVLDNASGDGTAEMIKSDFPDIRLEVSDTNLGFAKANNRLAQMASKEYVLLLNPDTIVHRGAISALVSFARNHPSGGLYGGRTLSPSGTLDPSSCWGAPSLWSLFCFATGLSTLRAQSSVFDPESLGNWQRDSIREVPIVTGCLALIKTQLWRELGGFDESFWLYGEDADLSLRVRSRGFTPMITPDAEITHCVGASSSPSAKMTLVMASKARLIIKHWPARRAKVGVALLQAGCLLRAVAPTSRSVWGESWRRRREWQLISGGHNRP